ncbi:hypothetical protein TCON_1197 [Astathelohania contejeani]|uniref:Uncharacterized protein n=1 Tax=Astathelohania contejeani TaxID=164912 RepID=A0ABQ7HZH4_9MICR|nr:hypothetical protein TCON_1197 [Thelohania contejeani]
MNINYIKEYVNSITIEYIDSQTLEQCYAAMEIGNKKIDPLSSPVSFEYPCDELLFILNYLFMAGYEYSYTLGCAGIMHKDTIFREVYEEVAYYVYEYAGLVSHDRMQYYVANRNPKPSVCVNTKGFPFLGFQCQLLSLFKTKKIDWNKMWMLLKDGMEGLKDDHILYTEYNTLNILHGSMLDRNRNLKLCSIHEAVNKIKEDLHLVQKILESKYRPNFYLRNINKIRSMLAPFRGYIFKQIELSDMKYSLFFMDSIKIRIQCDEKYFLYYLMEKYFLVLKKLGLVEQSQINGLALRMLAWLSRMGDDQFMNKKKDYWMRLYDGGEFKEEDWVYKAMGFDLQQM